MNQHYPHMFAPLTVGNITFKNRVFSAPTTAHMIQNNAPSYPEPSYIATYLEKARGGVACVSCGGQKVTLTGRNPVHTEFNITEPAGWRNFIHMTSAMHFYDARCSYELIHFGSEGEYTEEARKDIIYGCSDFVRGDGLRFHQMPVEEMEKLHITADVSHLSDKGFWDIANHSTRPFAASHSNCRALSPHNRNLTDEMIRALAEKGGIAGLNYCASFVDADSAHPKLCRSTVERLAKHAAHFKQVGGIEVISLGSDFDGIGGQHELETAADMPLLAEALRREGFTEDEVEAIFWRNAYRFFKNNL